MPETIQTFLSWWTIVGYFLVLVMPRPKTKKAAAIIMTMCGPAAWVFVAGYGIVLLLKRVVTDVANEGSAPHG